MTSRERVIRALEHREPDRVPLDIGGGSSTSIVVEGYEKLKDFLGITGKTLVMNRIFRVARIDEGVLRRLGADCYPVSLGPPDWPPPDAGADDFTDIWGIGWRKVYYGNGCFYYELSRSPLEEAEIEDLERYAWPDTHDPGYTRGLAEEARQLFEGTEWALVGDGGFKSLWELGYMLRGYERFLIDLASNPKFADALLSKLLDINMAVTGRFLEAVGPFIQVFRTADDVATQRGPLLSPAMYRRFLKPLYRRYYEFVKSRTDAKIFYHSCGNVTDLLEDFIDNGIDIINPVQVSAMPRGKYLKERFGDRLVFWGGVDTQQVLPAGTEREVEREVCRRIREFGQGGGYVLAAVHNIQPDVQPRNILAMARAAREHGNYPLS
jgi:uroporphyrinogen decarboxylase